ncbi:MAPEG family protein [Phenylobacterium sp.]|uniref:MAPEG family protein n=1 Tax=Phenylobacterium sp. TaxID=1871053 RepID=UPI00286D172B|nr:MAPEG family protein [Phenylobacterium sp.]
MMMAHRWTALVTILALLVYFWMGLRVAGARGKAGIAAPAMTGEPVLERTIRAHYNTLEWLPMFLVGLWLFALYWNELVAAGLGVVWIIGRVLYAQGYVAEASKRSTGFMIQSVATGILLFGALGRIAWSLATGGV